MPHYPKPFFRTARNSWFVQIGDRQIKLSPDKEAAFARYHELMAKPPPAVTAGRSSAVSSSFIIDEFLDWCEKHRAPDTYRWYKDRLNPFARRSTPPSPSSSSGRTTCRNGWTITASRHVRLPPQSDRLVKRAMKWAEEQGYVERSPLAHMKKPGCGRKELVVTPSSIRAARPHEGSGIQGSAHGHLGVRMPPAGIPARRSPSR